jgi:hypothetical protein
MPSSPILRALSFLAAAAAQPERGQAARATGLSPGVSLLEQQSRSRRSSSHSRSRSSSRSSSGRRQQQRSSLGSLGSLLQPWQQQQQQQQQQASRQQQKINGFVAPKQRSCSWRPCACTARAQLVAKAEAQARVGRLPTCLSDQPAAWSSRAGGDFEKKKTN